MTGEEEGNNDKERRGEGDGLGGQVRHQRPQDDFKYQPARPADGARRTPASRPPADLRVRSSRCPVIRTLGKVLHLGSRVGGSGELPCQELLERLSWRLHVN